MLGTATHALGIIHSHSESARLRTTTRGSITGRFRQPIAEIGRMKGLFHWRLLGAHLHLLRRRAGCLQPENSGPFVLATARTLGCLCAPAPLCVVLRPINLIRSISRHASSAPRQPTGPPRPVRSATQRSRRASEKKNGSGGQRRATVPLALHRPTRPPARTG